MAVVSGPFGAKFGNDPGRFIINVTKAFKGTIKTLTVRWVQETGVDSWTVDGGGGKPVTFPLKGRSSDDIPTLATKMCLCAIRNPGAFLNQASRMAMGIPAGARGLDSGSTIPFELPPMYGVGKTEAGEEGEPITIIAFLTVAAPIIIAIAPIVLPMLFDLLGDAAAGVKETLLGGDDDEKAPAPAPPQKKTLIPGVPDQITIFGGAVAAVLLLK